MRFGNVFRASLYGFEDAYLQHAQRLLDDAAFASTVQTIRRACALPGYRVAWRMQRTMHGPGFVAFMDGLMMEVPVAFGFDSLAAWNAALAEIREEAPGLPRDPAA
jgi:hypothetical protein